MTIYALKFDDTFMIVNSKLDASWKALDSDVYSVRLAVMKNVGIPVGMVLGQSESTEMFASFAECLFNIGSNGSDCGLSHS
jgi:hypothetical protein